MRRTMFCFRTVAILAIGFIALPAAAQRRGNPNRPPEAFGFRFVGPAVGNRIAAVAGIPGDPSIYYAGAASGGIWKTTDGGLQWNPISDSLPVAAIGALAVAPSDVNTVWAGTGEAWAIRDSDMMGNGVYKSVDAGKTWTHMGLEETGRIGRVIVHPTNPDIVYACALGRVTGPQQERGVYRTMDGGQHWDRVLFADENTGCSGLSIDAHNPRVLFAGMWQVEMHTWGMFSGGAGSAIYVSRDGGTKWSKVENRGLPRSPVGKIDVVVAPTNSNRVYALIQTKDQGSVWRSDDGGENWRVVNWDRALIGRAGYYIRIAVSPGSDNEVLVANSSFHSSTDGGETFRVVPWGGDTHDIWMDPKNPDRFAITDDAGMMITTQHGRSQQRITLPIGQMYHVAVDNQVPYFVYSNMQDNGTMRGVSTMPEIAGARNANPWEHGLGGCESGFTLPDPVDTNIIWSSCYGSELSRYDARTKRARSVSPWIHTLDSPPTDSKYRCHWTPPLAIDPFDHNTVYFGCQVIFRSSNGGQSWTVISPDLSTQDPKYIVSSGGIVGDNLGQFYGELVFAIAPSEIQKGLIWAGTNDGQVWYTKDAGAHWNNVSKGVTIRPGLGVISKIEPSHFDPGTAYVTLDMHLEDDRNPHVFKTIDFGKTWASVTGNLPKGPLAYVRTVAEDPNRKGLLYAGSGNAFYYSLDDGAHWTQLQRGLPAAPVSWIATQKHFHDVVVSTYGRGIYVLDDVTPLEQMAGSAPASETRLYEPRPAYRFVRNGAALINYWLPSPSQPPPTIEILDSTGQVIRKLTGTNTTGLNRMSWDLHYEPPRLIALRTTPAENPHIWEEPRFRGADSRPVTHWGIQQAQSGPFAAPGKYSVRLTVNGKALTQPVEILRDPKTEATNDDLTASFKLQLRIRNDITETSDMVNRLEWMLKQLEDIGKMTRGDVSRTELAKAVQTMNEKLRACEYKLLEKSQTLSDDKYYVEQYKVYMNLIWLNGEVGTGAGDVAGGADWGPTETSVAVLQEIERDLEKARKEYTRLTQQDVPAFNRMVAEQGVTPLTTGAPAANPPGRRERN